MNRAVIEEHAVQIRLIGVERRSIFVAADGLEEYWLANFAGLDAFHGRSVSGIVSAHETDLQAHTGFRNGLESSARVGERERDGLFAEDVFFGVGRGDDSLRVKLVRRGNQDGLEVFVF